MHVVEMDFKTLTVGYFIAKYFRCSFIKAQSGILEIKKSSDIKNLID